MTRRCLQKHGMQDRVVMKTWGASVRMAHMKTESQMFQEHCTTADDGMCEAEAAGIDWIPEVLAD
ncbi:hypothetical protein E2320_001927 [Naja naja]|nr:hypothetical protein E2320_001927 [Naja naja]